MDSPVVLQKSGIDSAGKNLFIDTCAIIYGVTPEIDISAEPPMQLVDTSFLEKEGFILTTGYTKNRERLKYYLGDKAEAYMKSNWISILIKIADDYEGRIYPDGTFSKDVTANDLKKIDFASDIVREILKKAGAPESSFVKKQGYHGGHNGATTAIGKVVDSNLQTEVANLFVCDSGVLPKAPGLPPILTIISLARRLARYLS
jgi:choline dehydrogenase-like flavoprotein